MRGFPTRLTAVWAICYTTTLLLIYMQLKSFIHQQHFHNSDPTNAAYCMYIHVYICAKSLHQISARFVFPLHGFLHPPHMQTAAVIRLGSSGETISNQVCGLNWQQLDRADVW